MTAAAAEARLLVVDDEPNIVELLSASLRFAGFEVATAANGVEALRLARTFRPDLLVLDVMMPEMDGFDLSAGCAARAAGPRWSAAPCFGVEIDDETHEVWKGGTAVALSPTEFKLLRYFLQNAGRVLSKAQILDHVWNYDFGPSSYSGSSAARPA